MEDLQIRRRRLDQAKSVPAFCTFDCGQRSNYFDGRGKRQIDVVVNCFVVIEGDLSAFASGILLGRRFLRFAVTVR